jgi:hypothetical protein
MTKRRGRRVFVLLACATALAQDEEIRWKKTVAPDRSFSLHCPDAWAVAHNAATVTLRNDPSGEQVAIVRLPRQAGKQPAAYAEQIAGLFRKSDPNFRMTELKVSSENAGFRLQYGQGYSGLGVVIEHPATVFWASYASLNPDNLRRRGALLTAIAQSISDNADSPLPGRLTVSVARGGNGPPAATDPPPPQRPTGGGNGALIGNWSTTSYFGELVDPGTGVPVQSAYSGQWYTFRPDGTYHYVMAASGQIISGIVMAEGAYELRGSQLVLHQKTTSWYPFAQSVARHPRYTNRAEPRELAHGIVFHNAAEMVLKPATGMADQFRKQPGK